MRWCSGRYGAAWLHFASGVAWASQWGWNVAEAGEVVWTPSPSRSRSAAIALFAAQCGFDMHDYAGLHRWSVDDRNAFYSKLWSFLEIIGEKGTRAFVEGSDQAGDRYFPDASLNYAENVLGGVGERPAIVAH